LTYQRKNYGALWQRTHILKIKRRARWSFANTAWRKAQVVVAFELAYKKSRKKKTAQDIFANTELAFRILRKKALQNLILKWLSLFIFHDLQEPLGKFKRVGACWGCDYAMEECKTLCFARFEALYIERLKRICEVILTKIIKRFLKCSYSKASHYRSTWETR
jgi:hypothetical protein